MHPILDLERSYPTAATVIGTSGGTAAWIISHSAEISSFAGAIGAVCAAALGLIALAAKLINISRTVFSFFCDRRRRRRLP